MQVLSHCARAKSTTSLYHAFNTWCKTMEKYKRNEQGILSGFHIINQTQGNHMRVRVHNAFRNWKAVVDNLRSEEEQATARLSQAVHNLQGSARCIMKQVTCKAFAQWHRKTCHVARVSDQLLGISHRIDKLSCNRRLRYALQLWKKFVVAWHADREQERAVAHEHTLSRLALERRFFHTVATRSRCRQLFCRWVHWVLQRKNTRLTAQLHKLNQNYDQSRQAEQHRMRKDTIKTMVCNLHHSLSCTLASAFAHWRVSISNIVHQQRQSATHKKWCHRRMRAVILRLLKATEAKAWSSWVSFCRTSIRNQERHRQHLTLVRIHLKRCCAARNRVQTYWVTTAFQCWVAVVQQARDSEFKCPESLSRK